MSARAKSTSPRRPVATSLSMLDGAIAAVVDAFWSLTANSDASRPGIPI